MRKPFVTLLVAAVAVLPCLPAQAAAAAYEPIYITDGQFTATLDQRAHRWRLQPLRGDEIEITDHSQACGSRAPIPHGLWYVSQDARGRPELVAPSVTPLPNGYPARVALHACGETAAEAAALFVPDVALTWINDHVGSVLIDD
jgi:hypothetical protein